MKLHRLIALVAVPLMAHDLYLVPKPFRAKPGEIVTVAFHNGDDFPVPDRPPRVESMLNPQARVKGSPVAFLELRIDGKFLLADVTLPSTGTAVLSVHSKPNLIELQPLKFEEYLKHEGLEHVIRWRAEHSEAANSGRERYSKYVKSLVVVGASDRSFSQPVGFPIEIIPDGDPSTLKAGDTLAMHVLFRGKPAADLQIEMAWLTPEGKAERKIAGRTDQAGKLRIPIGSRGIWKLHSVLMERCAEPAVADWESFWTSLTFEVR
jgi:hypothetical protein